jgi:hypothetical protein
MTFSIKEAVIALSGLLITVCGVAFAWQQSQDQKLSDLDKLIEKNKTILELQTQIQEKAVQQPPIPVYQNYYGQQPPMFNMDRNFRQQYYGY